MVYQPNLAQWHLVSYGYSTGYEFIYKYAIDTKYISRELIKIKSYKNSFIRYLI